MTESIHIREISREDEAPFLAMTNKSKDFHQPWVKAPLTVSEFSHYVERYALENQKSMLILLDKNIVGVINISEIVRGAFQSAYLGFYSALDYAGQGWMSMGLKAVIDHAFNHMGLHRLEANIQPGNHASLHLVKRNGFRKEGYSPRYLKINDKWSDHHRFAITVEEWVGTKVF